MACYQTEIYENKFYFKHRRPCLSNIEDIYFTYQAKEGETSSLKKNFKNFKNISKI